MRPGICKVMTTHTGEGFKWGGEGLNDYPLVPTLNALGSRIHRVLGAGSKWN